MFIVVNVSLLANICWFFAFKICVVQSCYSTFSSVLFKYFYETCSLSLFSVNVQQLCCSSDVMY
jgi:hypothetical protein